MARIESTKDFGGWLEGRRRAVSVALAARIALRILPLWREILPEIDADARRDILLPILRAKAASRVAAVGPTRDAEVRDAAARAAAATAHAAATFRAATALPATGTLTDIAAEYAADATAHAAATATNTFHGAVDLAAHADLAAAAYAAARATGLNAERYPWEALSADCTALEQGMEPTAIARQPLWPPAGWQDDPERLDNGWEGRDARPGWVDDNWAGLRRSLNAVNAEHWVVWTRWYTAVLKGAKVDLTLEEDRVLIDPTLWNQGPEAVNRAIQTLIDARDAQRVHRGLKAKVRDSQTIDINPTTGRVRFVPARMTKAGWYRDACEAVERRILRIVGQLEAGQINAPGLDPILEDLADVIRNCASRPQRVHDAFDLALKDLDEILTMTSNRDVRALRQELDTARLDIRNHRRDVEKVARLRAEARIKLDAVGLAAMTESANALSPSAEGEFREELDADTDTLAQAASDGSPDPLPESETKRAAYRNAAKIIWARDKVEKAVRAGDKGADAVIKLERLRDILDQHFPWLSEWLKGWF